MNPFGGVLDAHDRMLNPQEARPEARQVAQLLQRAEWGRAATPWFDDFEGRYKEMLLRALIRADAPAAYEVACQMRVLKAMRDILHGDLRREDQLTSSTEEPYG